MQLNLCYEELGLVCEDFAVETLRITEWKPLFLKLTKLFDVLGLASANNWFRQRLVILQVISDKLVNLAGHRRHNPLRKSLRCNFYLFHFLLYSKLDDNIIV